MKIKGIEMDLELDEEELEMLEAIKKAKNMTDSEAILYSMKVALEVLGGK